MTVTEVNLDFDRQSRTGLAEAVLCEGKTLAQLQTICSQVQAAARPMLFTRLDLPNYQALEQVASWVGGLSRQLRDEAEGGA